MDPMDYQMESSSSDGQRRTVSQCPYMQQAQQAPYNVQRLGALPPPRETQHPQAFGWNPSYQPHLLPHGHHGRASSRGGSGSPPGHLHPTTLDSVSPRSSAGLRASPQRSTVAPRLTNSDGLGGPPAFTPLGVAGHQHNPYWHATQHPAMAGYLPPGNLDYYGAASVQQPYQSRFTVPTGANSQQDFRPRYPVPAAPLQPLMNPQQGSEAQLQSSYNGTDESDGDSSDESILSLDDDSLQSHEDAQQSPTGTSRTPGHGHGRRVVRPLGHSALDPLARERHQAFRRATQMAMKMVASPQALASFERVEKGSLKPEDQTCIICYNEFGVMNPDGNIEDPVRLPKCKHLFGDHCLKQWLKDSDSCPYCRGKLDSVPRRQHPKVHRRPGYTGAVYNPHLPDAMPTEAEYYAAATRAGHMLPSAAVIQSMSRSRRDRSESGRANSAAAQMELQSRLTLPNRSQISEQVARSREETQGQRSITPYPAGYPGFGNWADIQVPGQEMGSSPFMMSNRDRSF